MARNPNDPNRIDVALEVVGQEGRAAIDDLARQVSELTRYLATAGSMDPATMAGAAQRAQTWGGHGTAGREAGSPGASRPEQVRPSPDEAGRHASNPAAEADADLLREGNMSLWRRTRENIREGRISPKAFIGRELDVYGAREREQAARRGLSGGDYDLPGLHAPDYTGGGPSGSASVPPVPVTPIPGEPRARYNLRSDPRAWERGQETATIPQFGEMTIQDKLRIGSGFLQRSADRAYQSAADAAPPGAEISAGTGRFMAAGLMRQGAEVAGNLYPVVQDFRRVGNFVGSANAVGASAGFEQRTAEVGPFGFFDPFSPAVREGMRQKWTTQRLRMKGGINGEQAAGIVNSLAANGFVGSEGQNLAFDAVSPLVQQGQNPGIVAEQFSEAIRNGATPMKEFRQTLSDLGPAARAARMSLDEYQQSLGGFANQMQELGGTYGQGYQLGRNLSSAYSMAPQQIAPVLQNPITQGMALRQGYLPTTMGAMGAGEASTAINQSIELAWNASNLGFKDIVDPKTGHVTTAEQQRNSQAASYLNMTPDEFQKYHSREKVNQAGADVNQALASYQDARTRAGTKQTVTRRVKDYKDWSGKWIYKDEKQTVGSDNKEALKALDAQSGMDGSASWTTVNARLHDMVNAAAPEDKQAYAEKIRAIDKLAPDKRMKEAAKFVAEQNRADLQNDGAPVVRVKFTGKAEKFFQQEGSAKAKANSGGPSVNESTTSPSGGSDALRNLLNTGYSG